MNNNYIAVIPAFEPDERLVLLSEEAQSKGFSVVIVDDGSGEKYREIFEKTAGSAQVISYPENRGKGHALKTAFRWIRERLPERISEKHSEGLRESLPESTSEGVQNVTRLNKNLYMDPVIVVLDCDGQHTVEDALKLCGDVSDEPDALWLGSRKQSPDSPLRSRMGNAITRNVFRLVSGTRVYDTQTGMRAFSAAYLPLMLQIPGERYEYEMNMLLAFSKRKISIREREIATIYFDNNAGSHFHTVRDSFLIYRDILKTSMKFSVSSLLSFAADYLLFSLFLLLMPGELKTAVFGAASANILARILSASLNYYLNRRYVFQDERAIRKSAFRYFLLAAGILAANTGILFLLTKVLQINVFTAKLFTEAGLFLVSFLVQKSLVFRSRKAREKLSPGIA